MFWSDPASQFFAGKKRPKGLPRTDTRGKEIKQKLPNDPAKKPPYFVSRFDPDETPLSIQRTKSLLSRPEILESIAGTTSMLGAGELQVFPVKVFLRPW